MYAEVPLIKEEMDLISASHYECAHAYSNAPNERGVRVDLWGAALLPPPLLNPPAPVNPPLIRGRIDQLI